VALVAGVLLVMLGRTRFKLDYRSVAITM